MVKSLLDSHDGLRKLPRMEFYQGCTALITGASAGLGVEFARQLAPFADRLILAARRLDRLETLKSELETDFPGLQISVYGVDFSDAEKTEEFIAWIHASDLQPNLLINNAGLGDYGAFERSEWSRISAMIEVNIKALTRLTQALLPTLRAAPSAAILNVSSVAGLVPLPDMAVYAATKAYVTSFSEALRAELRGTGISVTSLCPGPVATEFGGIASRENDIPMPMVAAFQVSAEDVVAAALRAVKNDRARVIPGLKLAMAMTITALVPIVILRLVLNRRPKEWFREK